MAILAQLPLMISSSYNYKVNVEQLGYKKLKNFLQDMDGLKLDETVKKNQIFVVLKSPKKTDKRENLIGKRQKTKEKIQSKRKINIGGKERKYTRIKILQGNIKFDSNSKKEHSPGHTVQEARHQKSSSVITINTKKQKSNRELLIGLEVLTLLKKNEGKMELDIVRNLIGSGEGISEERLLQIIRHRQQDKLEIEFIHEKPIIKLKKIKLKSKMKRLRQSKRF